ncbi:MAG: hypothetical protein ABI995_15605, partial [Acidobacteriota bacterium]
MNWRLIAGALMCGVLASAHEIGTTRVSAEFREGRYYIEVVTDAAALAEKLGGPVTAEADELFRQRVKVMFDGAEVRPDTTYRVEPAVDASSAAAAIIHLTGTVPAGAKRFTWNFGWTFASYAVTIRSSPSNPTEWLEGGQTSAPFSFVDVAPAVSGWRTAGRYLALGFTHILPYGLDHMLFVLGIYLLSRR